MNHSGNERYGVLAHRFRLHSRILALLALREWRTLLRGPTTTFVVILSKCIARKRQAGGKGKKLDSDAASSVRDSTGARIHKKGLYPPLGVALGSEGPRAFTIAQPLTPHKSQGRGSHSSPKTSPALLSRSANSRCLASTAAVGGVLRSCSHRSRRMGAGRHWAPHEARQPEHPLSEENSGRTGIRSPD